jgi:TrmH family RNA methyltransferase
MLVEKITSRQNPLVKRFRRVRNGGEYHLVMVEGVRLLEEALSAGRHFESVAFTSDLDSTDRGLALKNDLRNVACRGAYVSQHVMEAIADTEHPQGIAALISRPYLELAALFTPSPRMLVVADGLQDPGNLGTIIRTAEAAGANGLITTRGTVDPFNSKALRASMGSAFRLPIATDARRPEVWAQCHDHGMKIVVAHTPSRRIDKKTVESRPYSSVDWTVPMAIVVGSEAHGIASDALAEADLLVHIPMSEAVESLNVSAAASILLYEAARQRQFRFEQNLAEEARQS